MHPHQYSSKSTVHLVTSYSLMKILEYLKIREYMRWKKRPFTHLYALPQNCEWHLDLGQKLIWSYHQCLLSLNKVCPYSVLMLMCWFAPPGAPQILWPPIFGQKSIQWPQVFTHGLLWVISRGCKAHRQGCSLLGLTKLLEGIERRYPKG